MNIGAFGFWLFWAAVIIAWTWWATTRRKTRYETLSTLINKGDAVDPRIIENILQDSKSGRSRLDIWLMIIGLVVLFSGIGFLAMGPFLGRLDEEAKLAVLGLGTGTVLSSFGFIVAAFFVKQHSKSEHSTQQD